MSLNGYKRPLLGALSIALAIIGWAAASWVRMVEEHVRESSAIIQRVRANEVGISMNQERLRQLEYRVRLLEQGRSRR